MRCIDIRAELVSLADLRILQEVDEGSDYAENARRKATTFAVQSALWTIADDSGLEVDALDGAPGPHSARLAGPQATDADRPACCSGCSTFLAVDCPLSLYDGPATPKAASTSQQALVKGDRPGGRGLDGSATSPVAAEFDDGRIIEAEKTDQPSGVPSRLMPTPPLRLIEPLAGPSGRPRRQRPRQGSPPWRMGPPRTPGLGAGWQPNFTLP
jgi:hypothetical protein